jgi:hypothetical protein
MKLKYDHAYTPDQAHRFLKQLKKMGFKPSENTVEHHGKHFCHFILFRDSMKVVPVYLEFIHVGRGGKKVGHSGLSLRAVGSLEKASKEIFRSGLKGKLVHKNYDWKAGGRDRRPGWNFLNFKNVGFRKLYPWITEYEVNPNYRGRRMPTQRHPNGVRRLLALEIEIDAKGARFFERLLGRKVDQPLRLPGGQKIYFTRGKQTRLRAIVLEADSTRRFKQFKLQMNSEWRGRRACSIENPSGHWNLLLVAAA